MRPIFAPSSSSDEDDFGDTEPEPDTQIGRLSVSESTTKKEFVEIKQVAMVILLRRNVLLKQTLDYSEVSADDKRQLMLGH
jgi:hypothetical protein